jgi:hypothetical protein
MTINKYGENQDLQFGAMSFVQGSNISISPDGRLDAESAAAYLSLSAKTLANYRCRGIGPRFIKRGRIFYRRSDLDAWLADGECQSTAQARLKAAGNSSGSH